MNPAQLNIALAFIAGLLSFLSPCILPLIPSYLSFVGGISYNELKDEKHSRMGIFINTLLFVLGFSVVFITLGVLFSTTGMLLGNFSQVINIIAGIIVLLLGFNFIFDFWKILEIEKKFHIERKSGYFGSIIIGMAFAAGWTPCVGPILAGILFLAGTSGNLLQGVVLLTTYSIGLGLPFIMAGLFFNTFSRNTERLKPYMKSIKIASGIFLIIVGILIILGRLQKFNVLLFSLANRVEKARETYPIGLRNIFTLIFLIPGIAMLIHYIRKVIREKKLHPGWLIFTIFLITLGILTFTGVIDMSRLITFWFTFQGI